MEVFTQFSSDLDDATKKQLAHGRALMELLKQPLGRPFSMPEQVIILVAANAHIFSDVEIVKLKKFRADMLDYFAAEHSDIISQLNSSKDLTDDLKEAIVEAATAFKNNQE
jgi:F-type H+-transporting ATPase subunit alpha